MLEPPEVHVVQDPLVVFAFVALFAAVVVLAVLFATPRFRRVPEVADELPSEAAHPDEQDALIPPTTAQATQPWSTSTADDRPPWHLPGHEADRD